MYYINQFHLSLKRHDIKRVANYALSPTEILIQQTYIPPVTLSSQQLTNCKMKSLFFFQNKQNHIRKFKRS